ncbi:hypothetical protein ACYSM9_21100 [Arthrobacter sp. C152]
MIGAMRLARLAGALKSAARKNVPLNIEAMLATLAETGQTTLNEIGCRYPVEIC